MRTIEYVSTRGNAPPINFRKLVMSGTAPGAGLYVPDELVLVTQAELQSMRGMTYDEVAYTILSPYAKGFDALQRVLRSTYTAEKFRHVRPGGDPSKIVNVYPLWGSTYLAELIAGPTRAFKDIPLQYHGQTLAEVLQGGRFTLLGGTSGDTGSAAIEAFKHFSNINIFMMSGGAMSAIQEAQMYTVLQQNVHNLRLPDFDTTQSLFKEVFADRDFVTKYNLGAVNSINLNRILAQVVYAFWTYLQVAAWVGQVVDYVVPSGNAGHVCSVYMAKLMGLPVGRIIVATNENDVLHTFFETGVYERAASVTATTSPSMDIQVASNLERIIYYALGGNTARVQELYDEFRTKGRFTLRQDELLRLKEAGFVSVRCDMKSVYSTIGMIYGATRGRIMIDPHTATAVYAADQLNVSVRPMLIYETAGPDKFADTVEKATGDRPPMTPEFADMLEAPQRVDEFSHLTAEELKAYIAARVSPV